MDYWAVKPLILLLSLERKAVSRAPCVYADLSSILTPAWGKYPHPTPLGCIMKRLLFRGKAMVGES